METKVIIEDAKEISDKFQTLDKTECCEQKSNVIQDCGTETHSETENSRRSKDLPLLLLQKTHSVHNEFLSSGIDESTEASLCVQTDVGEGQEHNSLEKSFEPFNISGEQELFHNKYKPVKRNLPHNTINLESSQNDLIKNLSILPSIHECFRKSHDNSEVKSAAQIYDPFNLSPEKELSRERYQPLKRKLHLDCPNNKISYDKTGSCVKSAEIGKEVQKNSAPEVIFEDVSETKKGKSLYRVTYVHSQELLKRCNKLIRVEGRAQLVHSLINAFGLLSYLEIVSPRMASDVEIFGFHCPDYITFLRDASASDEMDDDNNPECKEAESYGLSYDCPLQNGIYETCCLISGGTIVAAETLLNDTADIAINWYGGWHHAKRDSASGFCYMNDIVLGLLKLREKYDRILYVDIDLHHGDGVEEAFYTTPKVMTVSFHKLTPGFFPGSGSLEGVGTGKGKFYSVNVPLLDGIKDTEFCAMFFRVMKLVKEKFQPQVIVMQCGADGLSSDPMVSFNLTHNGFYRCVSYILTWNLPTMLLGGGGYNFPNTAKSWTFLTSLAVSKKLPQDIPEHEHLLAYGPDFEMSTTAGNRKDLNTKQYLANVLARISRNLSNL